MASSVATVFHGLAAGDTFTPAELRSGLLSRAGVVQDGSTAGKGRPGIMPGAGTPLAVVQAGTPAMKVKVFAGTAAQLAPGSPGGMYSHTLTADTELDIATSPSSNTRWDVVVAKVFDDGVTPATTIEVLTGAAAPSPSLPSALSSPPLNTNYYPIARVLVGTNVTSILNAAITKPAASGGLPAFGQFTVAPGGMVPVANLSAAAELPLHSPFYSIADRAVGRVQLDSTGAKVAMLEGHQHRYIRMPSAPTNSNGDINPIPFGLYFGGVFAAVPFPNECFGFTLQDASNVVSLDTPLTFKTGALTTWQPSTAAGIARVYQHDGSKYTSSLLDLVGIAWGR